MSTKGQRFLILKIKYLMLLTDMTAVYSENHTKFCEQNAELQNVKRGGAEICSKHYCFLVRFRLIRYVP